VPSNVNSGFSAAAEARLTKLEDAVEQVEDRLRSLRNHSAIGPSDSVSSSLLEDVSLRLKQVEGRLDAPLGSGGGEDFHHQFVELHRQHLEMHRQVLDTGVRLSQLEQLTSQAAPRGVVSADDLAIDVANLKARLAKLENVGDDAAQKLEEELKKSEQVSSKNAAGIQSLQQHVISLVKFVSGETPPETDDRPTSPSSSSSPDWPISWLQTRIDNLFDKRGGLSLEARLHTVEQAGQLPPDTGERLQRLEKEFHSLDLPDLARVRPDLLVHQRQQEEIDSDIMRELKELKCLVGCIEACIPRETRKAVQLFKRAAGAGDSEPQSPREFKLESKILQLREEVETQIQDATATLHHGREHMTKLVKSLEKKHEILDARLEDVRNAQLASRPVSSEFSAPGQQRLTIPLNERPFSVDSDNRTQLQSAPDSDNRTQLPSPTELRASDPSLSASSEVAPAPAA
jgi:hypothetical protein